MLSNYLKEYFKKKKISQQEIERKTGISQSKVNLSLNNKRKLTAEELLCLANEFDIDLNKIKEIIQSPNLKWFLTQVNENIIILTNNYIYGFDTRFIADIYSLPAILLNV